MRSRIATEQGSVSVVVAAAVGMSLIVTMGAADVGRALVARSRAEAVADLAALAAAAVAVVLIAWARSSGKLPAFFDNVIDSVIGDANAA